MTFEGLEAIEPRRVHMPTKRDERWIEPLTEHDGRSPWRFRGGWIEADADSFRHIHCVYYERCLATACKECKSTETWACPASCTGRLTYVEFEPVYISEELSGRLKNN